VAALKAEQPPRPAGTVTATTPAAATGAAALRPPRAATAPTAPAASSATAAPNAASRPAADTVKRTPADSARLAAENRSLSYGELVGKSGGLTPLLFAVRQGHSASVLALLAAGADVNQVSAGDHTSPLLMATINGQFDLAMVLLGKGAKPTLASDAGTTPLYATINVQWAPCRSTRSPRHSCNRRRGTSP
jgi:hypothetical protein